MKVLDSGSVAMSKWQGAKVAHRWQGIKSFWNQFRVHVGAYRGNAKLLTPAGACQNKFLVAQDESSMTLKSKISTPTTQK